MKRLLFLSIVALFAVLSLLLALPRPVAPATAFPSPHPVATMPTVTAVGITATAPTTATAAMQPTAAPTTEPPGDVKPVEPPAPPAQQGKAEAVDTTLYQLRGIIASQALGKTVNINNSYGNYSVRDGNQFVDISAVERIRVSAITTNGLDAK